MASKCAFPNCLQSIRLSKKPLQDIIMRAVLQRVEESSVTVNDKIIGEIGKEGHVWHTKFDAVVI